MEKFTFVICRDSSFSVEEFHGTRDMADQKFNRDFDVADTVRTIAYYGDDGLLINAWHAC